MGAKFPRSPKRRFGTMYAECCVLFDLGVFMGVEEQKSGMSSVFISYVSSRVMFFFSLGGFSEVITGHYKALRSHYKC